MECRRLLVRSAVIDPFEFVRTIAVARIAMPGAVVRLSAGREAMSDELQALCFMAGANSIFYGDRLLTTGNPQAAQDKLPFERLGLRPPAPAPLAETAPQNTEYIPQHPPNTFPLSDRID